MDTNADLKEEAACVNDQLLLRFRDDAQLAPYVVFTAGRSRTMWLSAFLTYGICACNFESTAKVNSFSDVVNALHIPGIGAAETLAAPAWPLLKVAAPTLRSVVVRRPLEEIIQSLVDATKGKVELDLPVLRKLLLRLQQALERISEHPDTLTVDFEDLDEEETCKRIFEHCLPYKHDAGWWKFMSTKWMDPDVIQLAALFQLREKEIRGLGLQCRRLLFRLGRQGHFEHLGVH
jgi:hypothetical protein